MPTKQNLILVLVLIVSLTISSCGIGQTIAPTITPNPTATFTPTLTPTQTPSSTPLPDEIVDDKGVMMRLVPAGEFTMGSDIVFDEATHVVYLDAYYIDKYEVTNALYESCVNAGACDPPIKESTSGNPILLSDRYGDSKYDDHPVILITWNMANEYCEWRGTQLPTEAQWEKAALGTDGRKYSWGEGLDCDKANYNKWVLGNPDGALCVGGNTTVVGSTTFVGGDTTPAGDYQSDVSPYGIYDMAGNVSEWVADWYDRSYYQNSPSLNPLGPTSGTDRVHRGGAWTDSIIRIFSRYYNHPGYISYDLGFRCASQASP